ncbi:MAG: mechanosensitive ion channel domain-containing protein [Janthinobacterium lividum]
MRHLPPAPNTLPPSAARHSRCLAALLAIVLAAAPLRPAAAADAPAPVSTAQARQILDLLNDPARRAQFAATLQAMAKAAPATDDEDGPPAPAAKPAATAATQPATSAATPAPAAAAPAPAAPTESKAPKLAPDSLGAALITQSAGWFSDATAQVSAATRTLGDFPLLWAWVVRTIDNPDSRARVTDAAWKLAVVLGAAILAEQGLRRVLRGPKARLARIAPEGSGEPDEDPESTDPDRQAEAASLSDARTPTLVASEATRDAAPATAPQGASPAPTISEALSRPAAAPSDAPPGADLPGPRLPDDLLPGPPMPAAPHPDLAHRPGDPPAGADLPDTPLGPPAPPPPLPGAAPPVQRRRHRTLRSVRRLPFVLLRLVLEALPLALFWLVATLLLGTDLVLSANTRGAILFYMQAYLLIRGTVGVVRTLLSPDYRSLRLVHVTDRTAAYTLRWVTILVSVATLGWATVETGMLFGLYTAAHEALLKLVALVDHLALVVMVLQLRAPVAARLHARQGRDSLWARALNRLASVWHWVAIFFIMAIWLVWASQIQNGFTRLLHFAVTTTAIAIAGRLVAILLLGGLDRAVRIGPDMQARYPGLQERAARYYPAARAVLGATLFALTGLVLLQAWGLGSIAFFWRDQLGNRIISAVVTVAVATILSIAVWEGTNTGIERQLERLSSDNQPVRAARLRTLTPILRTALLVVILLVLGMTVLSEIGVNIAPLLAGAGIVGVALGFGSQKLVQDFITGIFLLLENAMQVGDTVTVAGLSGTVEMLSIRTLRLRAGDGSIHIIPFSSVTTVNNANRDYANASVAVGVGYDSDTDRVGALLGEIVRTMREDPSFAPLMLGDLSLWGVDELGDSAVTIKGQVRTTVGGRWPVQREILRRVKKRFEAEGIDIPYPTRTLLQPDAKARPGGEASPQTPAS